MSFPECVNHLPPHIASLPTFRMPGLRHHQRAKKMKQKKRDRAALLDAQKLQEVNSELSKWHTKRGAMLGVKPRENPSTTTTVFTTSAPSGSTALGAHPGGLSSGAKAGISVAVILVLLVLLVLDFFLRRRKQRNARMFKATQKAVPPNTHELLPNANSHELFTKHNIPEMDEQSRDVLKSKEKLALVVASIGVENGGAMSRDDLAGVHELDPENHITSLDTENYLTSPHELEISNSPTRLASSSHVPALQVQATSSKDEPRPSNEERERKVELLTNRTPIFDPTQSTISMPNTIIYPQLNNRIALGTGVYGSWLDLASMSECGIRELADLQLSEVTPSVPAPGPSADYQKLASKLPRGIYAKSNQCCFVGLI
ncbi:hypothetical protein BGZ57DRAFT_982173 [Hyaloscypha finlandica]|nr:hypothetical protein BGZ57DRAFT_982173 [Hyaloscypha finlandica]